MSSDNAKRREILGLEWQGELDSHLADLDSRLKQTRRRAAEMPAPASMRSAEAPGREGGPQNGAAPGLRPGKMLMIRYKMPRLPWPFRLFQRRRRRREHPLTTAKVRA